jgi:hypothetical protein
VQNKRDIWISMSVFILTSLPRLLPSPLLIPILCYLENHAMQRERYIGNTIFSRMLVPSKAHSEPYTRVQRVVRVDSYFIHTPGHLLRPARPVLNLLAQD